eukprot:SAG22_NODE_181_length_16048_cov_157.464418_18_plen_88_part_00
MLQLLQVCSAHSSKLLAGAGGAAAAAGGGGGGGSVGEASKEQLLRRYRQALALLTLLANMSTKDFLDFSDDADGEWVGGGGPVTEGE